MKRKEFFKMQNSNNDSDKTQQIQKDLFKLFDQKKKNLLQKYRFKSLKYYQKQIRKPFNYKAMQNYQDIVKFQKDFDKYIEQNKEILKVKQNDDLDARQSIKKIKKKDIFQTVLILKDGRKSYSIDKCQKNQQNIRLENQLKIKRKHIETERKPSSKVQIYIDSAQSSFQSVDIYHTVPIKSKLKKSPTFLFSKPHEFNSSKKRTASLISNQYVSPQEMIESLKFHLKRNFSVKGLRIDSLQFTNWLKKQQGNEIVTKYYDMPKLLSTNNICQIANHFYKASKIQKNLIAFLTYDQNKDGIISQEDLFQIYNTIDINSTLHQDIYRMHQYSKKYDTKHLIPDISLDFVLNPNKNFAKFVVPQKFKNKLFFYSSNSQTSNKKSLNKLPKIQQKGKSTQLFTTILENDQKLDVIKFEKINQKIDKKIKINFQTFCKVFQELPAFAYNFLKLFRQQNNDKIDDFEQNKKQLTKSCNMRRIPEFNQKNERQSSLINSCKRKKMFTEIKRQVTLPITLDKLQYHKRKKKELTLESYDQKRQNPQKQKLNFEDYFVKAKVKKQKMQVHQLKLKQAYQAIKQI